MSIMRSIWNGPFYIGKLQQPVSFGDVLLKALEVLWRAMIAIIAAIMAIAIALAAYVYVIAPVFFPPLKDSIVATASYAANLAEPPPLVRTVVSGGNPTLPTGHEIEKVPCAQEFPIRITIYNTGTSTIARVSFDLEGYAPGFSTNYVENWGFTDSERILAPGKGWSACYGVRTKNGVSPSRLQYKVIVWSASEAH